MIIKQVKLNNIRSYVNGQIQFPGGSFLLSGDIGSGKSSILLAIEFALFGLKRKDLSGSALLRHGKKEGSVELHFAVDDKEVDIAVRDVMSKNNIAKDQFEQVLLEEGLTFEDYRKQLKEQMQKMRLLDQEIKSKIQITEKEVEKYYKENMDDYNTPPEVSIQQILLIIPSEASEQEINQIREKANGIAQKIREGEDFTSMVKLYSQDATAATGGVLGAFRQGELLPGLNKVVFSLEVGEVSSVIQTSRGFHIVKVLDKRERQKMTKEEKWNEIENFLYNQKFEDEFKQWMKKIRKRSYIKISL